MGQKLRGNAHGII